MYFVVCFSVKHLICFQFISVNNRIILFVCLEYFSQLCWKHYFVFCIYICLIFIPLNVTNITFAIFLLAMATNNVGIMHSVTKTVFFHIIFKCVTFYHVVAVRYSSLAFCKMYNLFCSSGYMLIRQFYKHQ